MTFGAEPSPEVVKHTLFIARESAPRRNSEGESTESRTAIDRNGLYGSQLKLQDLEGELNLRSRVQRVYGKDPCDDIGARVRISCWDGWCFHWRFLTAAAPNSAITLPMPGLGRMAAGSLISRICLMTATAFLLLSLKATWTIITATTGSAVRHHARRASSKDTLQEKNRDQKVDPNSTGVASGQKHCRKNLQLWFTRVCYYVTSAGRRSCLEVPSKFLPGKPSHHLDRPLRRQARLGSRVGATDA